MGYKGVFAGWKKEVLGRQFTADQIKSFIDLRVPPKRMLPKDKRKCQINNHKKKIKAKESKKNKPKFKPDKYSSPEWIAVRDRIRERDGHACVNCGKKKADGYQIHVHHMLYIPDMEVWEVPDWYLVTLCEECHKGEHSKRLKHPSKKF